MTQTSSLSEHKQWLADISAQALSGGHIWPDYAACEAALESNYGQSKLAVLGNNLFGMKARINNPFGELTLPTKEFENGAWIDSVAHWVAYPDHAACFKDRMDTLRRLAPSYPNYANALAASSGAEYVLSVSKTWSTDPSRGQKVLQIYSLFFQN